MKLLLVASALFGLASGENKDPQVVLGKKAPEFTLTPLNKNLPSKKFSEISKDKITVVNFWSAKCPYSIAWEDRLKTIYNDYTKKGVEFVMINSNSTENKEVIEKYAEEAKLPYPIWADFRSEIADLFHAKTTPHIYVFNKKGELAYVGAIDDDSKGQKKADERKNYLVDVLGALITEKAVAVNATTPVGCSIKRPKP